MSRKSRKNEAFDLPSFQMIRAASNGDIEAINAVLKHYEGYIAALSTRKMYDENRQYLDNFIFFLQDAENSGAV